MKRKIKGERVLEEILEGERVFYQLFQAEQVETYRRKKQIM